MKAGINQLNVTSDGLSSDSPNDFSYSDDARNLMSTTSGTAMAAHLAALMRRFPPDSAPGKKLAEWVTCNAAATMGTTDGQPDVLAGNVDEFAAAIGLDLLAREIFRFILLTDCDPGFAQLCSDIVATRAIDSIGLIAAALDENPVTVLVQLQNGRLRQLHLIESDNYHNERFGLSVPYQIVNALLPPQMGIVDIRTRLIGAPMTATLSLEDFAHVARERDFVLRILRGAVAQRSQGINILIHGGPGTGKSEFCKSIAAALKCQLFAVGETDEAGDEPNRLERITSLRLADRLMARQGDALLLFDEMEDVLQAGQVVGVGMGGHRRAGSKVFFNRMLEKNAVPVFWTANAIDEFDPAFMRRMMFVLEMKPMPMTARAELWRSETAREGLTLTAPDALALARRYRIAPAIMAQATRAVTLAAGDSSEMDFAVAALARPITGEIPAPTVTGFDCDLSNASIDLGQLSTQLSAIAAPGDVSLCLHGPSGTGKSAFARSLAERMGFEPLVKRASDLLSKWVGGTERLLANAFAEAREDNCFLIFDEVESLLWERGGATRSWEVSAVNELLVQVEQHQLPIACTTNHLNLIDKAALRRFNFKIAFEFLEEAQAQRAYQRFFGREAPSGLASVQHLTPADFAIAAKKRRILGTGNDDRALLALLEAEVAAKELPLRRIGFGR